VSTFLNNIITKLSDIDTILLGKEVSKAYAALSADVKLGVVAQNIQMTRIIKHCNSKRDFELMYSLLEKKNVAWNSGILAHFGRMMLSNPTYHNMLESNDGASRLKLLKLIGDLN
jgi:hypothetical protein